MTSNLVTYNNPSLKTLDVTTATGIGYKVTVDSAGVLEIGLSNNIINTAVVNTTTDAIISLQVVRGATTYTLATATLANGTAAGQEFSWVPETAVTLPGQNEGSTTDLTDNPFFALASGDTVQTNVTTAGAGGTPAGAYEANILIRKSTNVGDNT